MLMRNFTKREKIVLLVLILFLVVGFYFLMIHYPVTTRLEEIAAEKLEVEDQTTMAMAKGQIYVRMKNELNEIFEMPINKLTVMPSYDNKQTLMFYFNSVFSETAPSLRYDSVKTEGRIASRSISFSFTADSYETAKETLRLLTGTGFRCLMQNVTITPDDGDVMGNQLLVSGNIIFYELITRNSTVG